MATALWVVKAEYLAGFGNLAEPEGDEPPTRATMLSATSCGATSSTFVASVLAVNERDAVKDAMTLIARQAAWRGITDVPAIISTACANREPAGP